jgi:hypothetical protein
MYKGTVTYRNVRQSGRRDLQGTEARHGSCAHVETILESEEPSELFMTSVVSAKSHLMYSGRDSGGSKCQVLMTAPRVQTCIYEVPSLPSCQRQSDHRSTRLCCIHPQLLSFYGLGDLPPSRSLVVETVSCLTWQDWVRTSVTCSRVVHGRYCELEMPAVSTLDQSNRIDAEAGLFEDGKSWWAAQSDRRVD